MTKSNRKPLVQAISIALICTFLVQDVSWALPDCLGARSMFQDTFFKSELFIRKEFQKLWACGIDVSTRDKDIILLPKNTDKRVVIKLSGDKKYSGTDRVVPVYVYDISGSDSDKVVRQYLAVVKTDKTLEIRREFSVAKKTMNSVPVSPEGIGPALTVSAMTVNMPEIIFNEAKTVDITDIRVRALTVAGSIYHNTNYATNLGENALGLRGGAEAIRYQIGTDEGYSSLREAQKIHYSNIVEAVQLINRLWANSQRFLNDKRIPSKRTALRWRKALLRAQELLTECIPLQTRILQAMNGKDKEIFETMDKALTECVATLGERLERIDGKLEREDVDLTGLCAGILPLISEGTSPQKNKFFKVIVPSEPIMVKGNSRSIISAVANIAANAFKATHKHKGEQSDIRIELSAENDTAVIRISDNGPGMDESIIKKLSEQPFFTTGGTGVGLTEARIVSLDHGGILEITSEAGKGSVFTIRLPLVKRNKLTQGRSVEQPEGKISKNNMARDAVNRFISMFRAKLFRIKEKLDKGDMQGISSETSEITRNINIIFAASELYGLKNYIMDYVQDYTMIGPFAVSGRQGLLKSALESCEEKVNALDIGLKSESIWGELGRWLDEFRSLALREEHNPKNLVMQARMPKGMEGELSPLDAAMREAEATPLSPWDTRRGRPDSYRYYTPSASPGHDRIVFADDGLTVFSPETDSFENVLRLNENEADAIIGYIKRGGAFVFSTSMDIEWFYNKFLEPLSERLVDTDRQDILKSVYFITGNGKEAFAFNKDAGAFYRLYGAENGRKEEALRNIRHLINARNKLITEKRHKPELEPFVWTFDKVKESYVAKGRPVRIEVGTKEFGAPGFVWAGVCDAGGKWDYGKLYMAPLVRHQNGRHYAYLPEGCNVFTFFWTGTEEARSGKIPGHWEKQNFYIDYVSLQDEEETVFTETGKILPDVLITEAGMSKQLLHLPVDSSKNDERSVKPEIANEPAKETRLKKIFYDSVKYVYDSHQVGKNEVVVALDSPEMAVPKILWTTENQEAVSLSLYDRKIKKGVLAVIGKDADVRKTIALAFQLIGKPDASGSEDIETKLYWSGVGEAGISEHVEKIRQVFKELSVKIHAQGLTCGSLAFELSTGYICEIKMPPSDVMFDMGGPVVNDWKHYSKEGYLYSETIPDVECPEHFLPILEHLIRINYKGFIERTFERLFGLKIHIQDVEKIRLQYLRSGGLKYAFLAHVWLKDGTYRKFSIKVSYPWMNSDDRINMINSNSQWAKYTDDKHTYTGKYGMGVTICFKQYGQVLDSNIVTQEYIEGDSLKAILINKNIPFPVKAGLVKRAVNAYIEAFQKTGIAIFDPKPDNIILEDDAKNIWKIIDLDKIVSGDEYQQASIRTLEEYIGYLEQYYSHYLHFNIRAAAGAGQIVADDMKTGKPVMERRTGPNPAQFLQTPKPQAAQGSYKTKDEFIASLLGNMHDEKNLAGLFKIALDSYVLNGKKLVIAAEKGLGIEGCELNGFMRAINTWKENTRKEYPKMANLLDNIITMEPFENPDALKTVLMSKGIKTGAEDRDNNFVFVFAKDNESNIKGITGIGPALRASFIKEDTKDKSFTGFYYPLLEIAALAMMRELLGASISDEVERMKKDDKDFPIESVSDIQPYLVFTIIPKIEPYEPGEHMKRFSRVLKLLTSA